MTRSRLKSKGRHVSGSFAQLPHAVFQSPAYARLGAHAVKLLLDLFMQFRGSNNGDFTAAWSVMRKCGWHSKDTLHRALRQLLDCGWIIKTRQGGKHRCSLYAVTWKPIDDCGGKLDVSSTRTALGTWKQAAEISNAAPNTGQIIPMTVPNRRVANGN
jgi:hypothetical protein